MEEQGTTEFADGASLEPTGVEMVEFSGVETVEPIGAEIVESITPTTVGPTQPTTARSVEVKTELPTQSMNPTPVLNESRIYVNEVMERFPIPSFTSSVTWDDLSAKYK